RIPNISRSSLDGDEGIVGDRSRCVKAGNLEGSRRPLDERHLRTRSALAPEFEIPPLQAALVSSRKDPVLGLLLGGVTHELEAVVSRSRRRRDGAADDVFLVARTSLRIA